MAGMLQTGSDMASTCGEYCGASLIVYAACRRDAASTSHYSELHMRLTLLCTAKAGQNAPKRVVCSSERNLSNAQQVFSKHADKVSSGTVRHDAKACCTRLAAAVGCRCRVSCDAVGGLGPYGGLAVCPLLVHHHDGVQAGSMCWWCAETFARSPGLQQRAGLLRRASRFLCAHARQLRTSCCTSRRCHWLAGQDSRRTEAFHV